MKTTELYICECGNVFDDYETYENMPRYGLKQKHSRGAFGKILTDRQGNAIFEKCHRCRGMKSKDKKIILNDVLIQEAKANEYITTDSWEELGFNSRNSMSSALCALCDRGILHKSKKYYRPQKYFYKKA